MLTVNQQACPPFFQQLFGGPSHSFLSQVQQQFNEIYQDASFSAPPQSISSKQQFDSIPPYQQSHVQQTVSTPPGDMQQLVPPQPQIVQPSLSQQNDSPTQANIHQFVTPEREKVQLSTPQPPKKKGALQPQEVIQNQKIELRNKLVSLYIFSYLFLYLTVLRLTKLKILK